LLAWLIRHAESEANFGLATSLPAATALTDLGRAQARRLAAWFQEPPGLLVTSAYLRTKQTAEPTSERFPDVPLEEWPVQEFTYLNSIHGQPTTAAERRPLVDAYWRRAEPDFVESPGSESLSSLLQRVDGMVERLRNHDGGPVAVFSHGVFIRAVLWSLLADAGQPTPESMRLFREFAMTSRLPNTAVIDLELGPEARLPGPWADAPPTCPQRS
jgi:probable phosphoglycerate mutase